MEDAFSNAALFAAKWRVAPMLLGTAGCVRLSTKIVPFIYLRLSSLATSHQLRFAEPNTTLHPPKALRDCINSLPDRQDSCRLTVKCPLMVLSGRVWSASRRDRPTVSLDGMVRN
jgi:hypothetical protein